MGKNNNESLSNYRVDEIVKSSRKITNGFECIIMKVRVTKHREECIAKGSRNVLIMNVCVCLYLWLYLRAYVFR